MFLVGCFFVKNFGGKAVIFAYLNRRLTLRKVRVNALKLRRKRPSVRGMGIYASFRFKTYYYGMNDFMLKNYIKAARKGVFPRKLIQDTPITTIRTKDKLTEYLEMRLDNVLQRSGIFLSQSYKAVDIASESTC